MCECCERDKELYRASWQDRYGLPCFEEAVLVRNENPQPFVKMTRKDFGSLMEMSFPVEHCPNCGRKL